MMITRERALQRLACSVIMQAIRDLRDPVAAQRKAARAWLFDDESAADRLHWCTQADQPYALLDRLKTIDERAIQRRLVGKIWK